MAAKIHGLKPYRIAALFHARRVVRKGGNAAAKLLPRKAKGSNLIFRLVIIFLFAPLFVLLISSFILSRPGEWTRFSFVW